MVRRNHQEGIITHSLEFCLHFFVLIIDNQKYMCLLQLNKNEEQQYLTVSKII